MATSAAQRVYTADFYCVEESGDSKSTALFDLLHDYEGRHAPAHALDFDQSTKFQLRSIQARPGGNIYSAVFGRCKYGEQPEQAAEDGEDSDVELKPGHGLVEKNHLLFFRDLNLVVFQRNGNAGRHSHFQSYLNKPTYRSIALVPILTHDSYSRLMNGGEAKKIEISFKKPSITVSDEEAFLASYINLFKGTGAGSAKIVLSAKRDGALFAQVKTALVTLAQFDRTRVARATMVDDNEVIDLLADRITHRMSVDLLPNGRPDPKSLFANLAAAKDACAEQLRGYFGT